MSINKNIECEIRGCITKGDFNDIRKVIEEDFGEMSESPELVIFFKGNYDLRLMINKNGGILILKETIDEKNHARRETELKFSIDNLFGVINFITRLGFGDGLFSYCYRFNTNTNAIKQKISIKFDTKIGDLFEIEQVVGEKANFSKIQNDLLKIVTKYGLNAWTQEIYKQIIKNAWSDVKSEPLLINNEFHPLIKKVIQELNKTTKASLRRTSIITLMKKKSNDYTILEKKFKRITKEDLLSWHYGYLDSYQESVSVIIPTYNSYQTLNLTLKSLENQMLHPETKKMLEVIVVDDGSKDETEQKIKNAQFKLNLKYIRQNNLGRAYARNLGVAISTGKIIVFLDSDIILEKHFLNEHIKRHHYLENIVLVSFKQNISRNAVIKNYFKIKTAIIPDIKNDFRFEKEVKKDWLRMHRHVRNVEMRKVKLLEETDNFKNFGKNLVLGVWDLPSMVITNAISIKRNAFEKIGGYNLQFKGWGMEDTFLGACLIANDNYIIPCFSTGIFHIEHNFRSGSQKKKIQEFNHNVLVYLDLINKTPGEVFKKN